MHLKHEKLSLAYCILLPFILIVYLIAMSLTEANYLNVWDLIFK
jgi:cytochrome c oxidase subunit IV